MKRLAGLAALGLASVGCSLLGAPGGQPTASADAPGVQRGAKPVAGGVTAIPKTVASPTVEVTALPTSLPTPVTSFTSTSSSQAFGPVTVVTISNTTRYTLLGGTADEIDRYMRTFGPADSAGTHWFALTEPLFNWNDTCVCDGGGCVSGSVTVTVTVDYTFPTWEPTPGADAGLVAYWNTFEDAVVRHEHGHGDLAATCGQWLGEAFVALPPQPSCAAVDSAMSAASGPVFAECRDAQSAYEAETHHGQNDGVLWPPY